jgi:hypothetical protein
LLHSRREVASRTADGVADDGTARDAAGVGGGTTRTKRAGSCLGGHAGTVESPVARAAPAAASFTASALASASVSASVSASMRAALRAWKGRSDALECLCALIVVASVEGGWMGRGAC